MTRFFWFLVTIVTVMHSAADVEAQMRDRGNGSRMARGSVSGQAIDGSTGKPVMSATVAIWRSADSTLVNGVIADAEGRFMIESLRRGDYYVKISSIGFLPRTIPGVSIRRGSLKVEMGSVELQPDTVAIDEVVITGERDFVSIGVDRTIYKTEDHVISASGSVSDVLENIPSVEVDTEGVVSLRGNQNVVIQVNGRPAPVRGDGVASFLESLPGDAVERVEVIPNPSARYEPDGMAGILNIVMKKNTGVGVSGGINAGFGTQDNVNASGNIHFRQDRTHLFVNYGFRYNERGAESDRYRENRFVDPVSILDQTETETRVSRSHLVNANIDYSLGDITTLSLSSLLNIRSRDEVEINDYVETNPANAFLDGYRRGSNSGDKDFTMDYALAYRSVFEPSVHELSAEARFNIDTEEELGLFDEFGLNSDRIVNDSLRELQNNRIDEETLETTLQLDYVRSLGDKAKLETGFKSTFRQLDNIFFSETFDSELGVFVPDDNLNNEFNYNEQVHALYGIYQNGFGPFEVQVGVRLEQALTEFDLRTTGETFENDRFNAFPSAFFVYSFTDLQSLKLSYSKRIKRPRTRQLNPFRSLDDPLNRRIGNPALNPEFTHSFELSYAHLTDNASLTLSPYFRHTVDVIRRLLTVDEAGVSTLTYENFDTRDSYGLETVGTYQINGALNAYASFNLFRVVTDGSNVDSDLSNDAIGWTTRVNATWTALPGLDFQFTWFYRAPMDIEGGRMGSRSNATIGVRQKLMNDNASLSVRVSDVFATQGFSLQREDEFFYQEIERSWDARVASLTFSYFFGKPERSKNNRRGNRGGGGDGMNDLDF